jgi:aminoglycoside phosphotransferase (APT) family kinase protein
MLVRLPAAAAYAEAVAKEQRWLPVLAERLPLPVPVPLAQGRPGADYPYPWSVYAWLPGTTAARDLIDDPRAFAVDLADVLSALQAVDPADGPRPGVHNWFRGGPLRTFDAGTHRALATLAGRLDLPSRLADIWAEALETPWDGVERWLHGDVAAGNLLLVDGRLAAVIDFGTCGVGDPACDLAVAWTLMGADARAVFRDRLGPDDATWARGRGWALWKALWTCAATVDDTADPEDAADLAAARWTLDQVAADHVA